MQDSLLTNNNAIIVGRVVSDLTFSHEVYGEGFFWFYVEVARLSQTTDILPVTISERLLDAKELPIGTFVQIVGQIRSYNNYHPHDAESRGNFSGNGESSGNTSANNAPQTISFNAGTRKNKLIITMFTREIYILDDGEDLIDCVDMSEFSRGNDGDRNPNNIYLNGFVCKPPVYRTTPFGREIADVLIAVNRSYNKSDYIPCIAWGRNAKFAGKLNVGDNIRIWGRLQSRNYQKRYESGLIDEKTAYEVSISKLENAGKHDEPDEEGTLF